MTIEQPRDVTIRKSGNKAELAWNIRLSSRFNEQYAAAQIFVDSEVLRRCDPYIPLLTGTLVRSGILGTHFGSGKVQWIAPYARYQYYGKVMAGKPKKPTSKNLVYHGGGKRGAFWFERMKEAEGSEIIKRAKKIAGGEE